MRTFIIFFSVGLTFISFASTKDTTYYKLVCRRNILIKDIDYCIKIDSTIYLYTFSEQKGDYNWRSFNNELDNKNIGLPINISIYNCKNYSITLDKKSIMINNNKLKKIKNPLDILFIQKLSLFNYVKDNISLFVENYNNLSNEDKYNIEQKIPPFNFSFLTNETLNLYFENIRLKLNKI